MSDSTSGATADGATQGWRDRRTLLVGGGIAIVVLALGAYFLLFAGSSSSDDGGGLVPGAARNAAAAGAPSAAATVAATLPAVYQEDPSGNPFKPLYPPAPTAAPTTEVLPAADSASGAVPLPDPGTASVPTSAPAPVPTATTEVTTKTVKVQLVGIVDDDTVTVRLNGGDPFAAKKGVVFGGAFSLASTRVDEGEATFNYGDGEPFTLTVGSTEKIVVTS